MNGDTPLSTLGSGAGWGVGGPTGIGRAGSGCGIVWPPARGGCAPLGGWRVLLAPVPGGLGVLTGRAIYPSARNVP